MTSHQVTRNINTDKPQHEDDIYTGGVYLISGLQKAEDKIKNSKGATKVAAFQHFSLILLDAATNHEMTRQTAAYMMSNYLSDDELCDHKQVYDILALAGNLELPYAQASNGSKTEYEKMWQELIDKTKTLQER